jgi:hypothetical protein
MTARPTVSDLTAWLGFTPQPGSQDDTAMQICYRTALEAVESRLRADAIPDAADEYPDLVFTAVVMQGAALWKRRNTPEGISFFEGGAIRLQNLDPNIEAMLQRFVRLDGFA